MMENCTEKIKKVQEASRELAIMEEDTINKVLCDLADTAVAKTAYILEANHKDLVRMDPADPCYDRLQLTRERIEGIAADIRNVARLDFPLGKVILEQTLSNGLNISKITVPLGIIGIIYEARPNVTFDVFSLCFKSGNACVLKGGSDAEYSNIAIAEIIKEVLHKYNLDENILYLMPASREATEIMLNAVGLIDVIIPRGGKGLIDFVRNNSKVPVIETGAGIVHTYFDESGDLEKGKAIVENAKTRRVSVCNALDCLIIHRFRLNDLPSLLAPLAAKEVEIFADGPAYASLNGKYPRKLLYPATPEHFGTEFLSLKMAIKTVDNLEEAINHITRYGSKHSEAIISEDEKNIEKFLARVDAAAVYANTSTAFTDGAQFGLGAEIGISTQKLHARGPMGLNELTSYKWIIQGKGQIRKP
ncbi:MAG: glutamate-5-semialdehyde dehydrogenase [Bacteroidota bacterium]|nr:glutamate-5-semialdehyde dehydrogenase [Bacteroidota bacterium]